MQFGKSNMPHFTPIKNYLATPLVLLLDSPHLAQNYHGKFITFITIGFSDSRGKLYLERQFYNIIVRRSGYFNVASHSRPPR